VRVTGRAPSSGLDLEAAPDLLAQSPDGTDAPVLGEEVDEEEAAAALAGAVLLDDGQARRGRVGDADVEAVAGQVPADGGGLASVQQYR
jgi:hypothetical protein